MMMDVKDRLDGFTPGGIKSGSAETQEMCCRFCVFR